MAKVNLSQLGQVLEKQSGHVFHVGIDVHKNSYSVAFYGDEQALASFVCSAEADDLVNQLKKFRTQIAQVVYEAGPAGLYSAG
jgi:hypothetical protein